MWEEEGEADASIPNNPFVFLLLLMQQQQSLRIDGTDAAQVVQRAKAAAQDAREEEAQVIGGTRRLLACVDS